MKPNPQESANIISLNVNTKVLVMSWKFIMDVFRLYGNGSSCILAVYLL